MIYLIGGPPRSGKSIIARQLAQKANIPYIALDDIQSAIRPYLDSARIDELLPFRQAWVEASGNNDHIYSAHTPAQIVELYRKQALTYWPGFKNLIADSLEDEQDYIFEGHQLQPHLVEKLYAENGSTSLKTLFVFRSNQGEIVDGLKNHSSPGDWVQGHTHSDDTYARIAETMILYGQWFEEEAKQRNYPVLKIDGDFQEQVRLAIEVLLEHDQP